MFFWNSLAFLMIQQMLTICQLSQRVNLIIQRKTPVYSSKSFSTSFRNPEVESKSKKKSSSSSLPLPPLAGIHVVKSCWRSVFTWSFHTHSLHTLRPQDEWLGCCQVERCRQALQMSVQLMLLPVTFQMLSSRWRTLLEWWAFNLAAGHLFFCHCLNFQVFVHCRE